jgi:glycine betaine/proline transport system permease protein
VSELGAPSAAIQARGFTESERLKNPAPRPPVEPGAPPPVAEDKGVSRWIPAAAVVAVWVVAWYFLEGKQTLALPGREHTDLHQSLTDFNNRLLASRDTNLVMQFTNGISELLRDVFDWLQRMLSTPNLPRPVPEIGWLGVTAVATWVGYAIASWRIALLVLGSFLSFGVFGYWTDSIDLLIVTGLAVGVTVILGMPLAVLVGTSARANRVITVFLDFMQTMPTFFYLVPIVLFFGIGVGGAVVSTLVYALPPIVRIAGFGIREVSATTIEATDSAGQTYWQRLLKVQIPMARKTIIVGLNQTILAALSMATIAAYINGPGLGKPVLNALIRNDFGGSFVPGVLIVVMAVMLDRTTTAASERSERVARGGGGNVRLRRMILVGTGVAALVAVYLSRTQVDLAQFPDYTAGQKVADAADTVMGWIIDVFGGFAGWLKDQITNQFLNRTQRVLAESPWWLAGLGISALAYVFGSLPPWCASPASGTSTCGTTR